MHLTHVDQGLNPSPLYWKHEVLDTGPPGRSLCVFFWQHAPPLPFLVKAPRLGLMWGVSSCELALVPVGDVMADFIAGLPPAFDFWALWSNFAMCTHFIVFCMPFWDCLRLKKKKSILGYLIFVTSSQVLLYLRTSPRAQPPSVYSWASSLY